MKLREILLQIDLIAFGEPLLQLQYITLFKHKKK